MSDESPILSLSNGRAPLNKKGDYITRGQAEQMVRDAEQRAHDRSIQVVNHLGQQVPGLVAQMVGDALAAHGLVLEPPKEPAPE